MLFHVAMGLPDGRLHHRTRRVLVGLGYGAVTELNQKYWALRVGYFLTGNVPNSNEFDMALVRRGSYVAELETRYNLFSRPGKLRVAIWANTYFSGSYSQALDLTLMSPGLDPTDAIVQTRRGRTKYGYYLNFEQAVAGDVGIFGRWSWNDGKNEISAFTDIHPGHCRNRFGVRQAGLCTGWLAR